MNNGLQSILNIKSYYLHRPLYLKLNLLKLKEIYEYLMIKFIHSCLYGSNSYIFDIYFISLLPNHSYTLREIKLNYPPVRIELERCMTIFQCVHIYNKIPKYFLLPQSASRLNKEL